MELNSPGLTPMENELAGVVRAELSRRKCRQNTVAAKIGLHPNTFGRKCRGQVAFTPGELDDLAKVIGTDAATLISDAQARVAATV